VNDKPLPRTTSRDEAYGRLRWGFWLGFIAVAMFAMTLPMSKLAVGTTDHPQLSPVFVTAGRAALAGLLSVIWLGLAGARWPGRDYWAPLAISALGTVAGFPIFLNLALREVEAIHAAVITGVLPLATAVVAAIAMRSRGSVAFWALAVTGCTLVLAFASIKGSGRPSWADMLLGAAVLSAAIGYVAGARVSMDLPGEQTICWVLVLSLPFSLPIAWTAMPTSPSGIATGAWLGFAYVTLFSMWIGFFFWYRGLAMGGVMRVSQVQLLQPFLALLFAVPITGEALDLTTIAFALAIVGVVFVSRRATVR
jgi:drug/metabolite transporter (DMT)-like permease